MYHQVGIGRPLWADNNGSLTYINMNNCNNEPRVLDIENHDLAVELSNGIYNYLRNEQNYKSEVERDELHKSIKSDETYLALTSCISEIRALRRQSKKLKWYQIDNTESKISALEEQILILYDKKTGERLWSCDVLDATDYYMRFMTYKHDTVIRRVHDTSTIKAILLQTPDLKTKSFKELLAIIDEQTRVEPSR